MKYSKNTVRVRLKVRRDTLERWNDFNPVLLKGEAGYITDTNELKIGDGVTSFIHLPSLTGSSGNFDFDPNGDYVNLRARGTTKEDVGLENVDNTSDLDKPISNQTQSALNNKMDKDETIDLGVFF